MSFNVSHVLFLLLQKFVVPLPKDPTITRQEKKIASHMVRIMQEAIDGDVIVEETEELEDENDGDWDVDEFEPYDDFVLPSHREVKFGDRAVSRDELLEALKFYREPSKGSRSLSCMTSNFRWIKTPKHLEKLRKFEKEKESFKESRRSMLKVLSARLYEVVKEKLQKGITLHDCDLMMIARDINRRETKVIGFLASQSWITRWKQGHRIVSRRVTKFVTRKCFINKDKIEKEAQEFVKNCRSDFSSFSPSMIFNADQCGIQKELYTARALAFLGDKIIERLIQAKSSLTHSFTFMPMLFMDGSLGPKAFMVLAESTGRFPPTRPIPNCPNLEVRAGKSHIMTKELMKEWLRTCVFIPNNPRKMFMVVDSWPSFKDHVSIQSCVPSGYQATVRNIPPHATSLIQPLDVHWNGPWKNLLKKFTAYALNFHTDYLIANRNNEIWMISLLYHQVSADVFKPFLQYSWKKAGYVDTYSPFLNPSQFCFGHSGSEDCYINGCQEYAFIHCARCKNFICFNHFIVLLKHLC
ncbi:hypothetical protein CAEBREN_15969 [Caenorhabditis brenneri]|uniref:HTH CENPB-type domain-containing protein n=1 Tax=Caenorhabditis brenneri TaxID=135651 RepID=G0MJ24_CAEBE|nr:hypothetical protein CAEBREN_15969 [Caenorhabditis brenneri]